MVYAGVALLRLVVYWTHCAGACPPAILLQLPFCDRRPSRSLLRLFVVSGCFNCYCCLWLRCHAPLVHDAACLAHEHSVSPHCADALLPCARVPAAQPRWHDQRFTPRSCAHPC